MAAQPIAEGVVVTNSNFKPMPHLDAVTTVVQRNRARTRTRTGGGGATKKLLKQWSKVILRTAQPRTRRRLGKKLVLR